MELLEDKVYREFFTTKPTVPDVPYLTPIWTVYVQKVPNGKWYRKRFPTYAAAFNWLKPRLKQYHDAAINTSKFTSYGPWRWVKIKGKYIVGSDKVKRQAKKQVAWKPKLPMGEDDDHRWCPYCRRPTSFRWFRQHHAIGKIDGGIALGDRRCIICGASERLLGRTLYPVKR
jgi:hypothetical protein